MIYGDVISLLYIFYYIHKMQTRASIQPIPCYHCAPTMKVLKQQLAEEQIKCKALQLQCDELTEKVKEPHANAGSVFSKTVPTLDFHPDDLRIGKFKSYVDLLMEKFPVLSIILNFFLTKSHNTKIQAKKTSTKWLNWAYFYHAWLVDNFLRA